MLEEPQEREIPKLFVHWTVIFSDQRNRHKIHFAHNAISKRANMIAFVQVADRQKKKGLSRLFLSFLFENAQTCLVRCNTKIK